MVRHGLSLASVVLAVGVACGGNGIDGPPEDLPDAVSLAGMAPLIAGAIRAETGVDATVDCPDTASVDDDGDVVTYCQALAPDGSRVEVIVASLSRPDHLDFGFSLADVPAMEEQLRAELGGNVACRDLVESGEGNVVTCAGTDDAGDELRIEVTLGRLDDDFTFSTEPAS
jgi:hypothetical protein